MTSVLRIAAAIAVLASGPQALATSPLQKAAQPIALGPERTSVLDNATVSVTRLRFAAGAREDVHTHPFPVLIVLVTSGQVSVADREMLRVGSRAGEVWFIPANTPHAAENKSSGTIEMLQVALKPGRAIAPSSAAGAEPEAEGITSHTLVDNADVQVSRERFAPGAREAASAPPHDTLTIQVSAGKMEIVNGAERSTRDREAGFAQFLPRSVQHAYASADSKAFELLRVSIK